MKLHDLMKDIHTILDRSGFVTSELKGPGGASFNLVSRRDDLLLLIKVVMTRDELTRAISNEMVNLARVLKGSPMIIVPSMVNLPHQDGVLYVRFGIPLLTVNTLFDHLIEEVPPLVYHASGGYFVNIDGALLHQKREFMKMSLGALGEAIGVSRKAIQMYESGMGADVEIALKLENALQAPLILPMDPFSYSDELQAIRDGLDNLRGLKKEVLEHLDSIGMEVFPTHKCPFDALVRDKRDLVITSVSTGQRSLGNRARQMTRIKNITGGDSVMIVSDNVEPRKIDGTPMLKISELRSTDSAKHLIRIIRERS